jgi:hypothetical protein
LIRLNLFANKKKIKKSVRNISRFVDLQAKICFSMISKKKKAENHFFPLGPFSLNIRMCFSLRMKIAEGFSEQ